MKLSIVCRSKISTYLPFIYTSYRPLTIKLIFLRHCTLIKVKLPHVQNCKIKYLFSPPSFAADISEDKNEFRKGAYRFLIPLLITLMCMRKDDSIVISTFRCFYLSLSVCLSVCMYVCIYVCMYILFILYSFVFFVCLFLCLFVFLFVCLFVLYVCMYVCVQIIDIE